MGKVADTPLVFVDIESTGLDPLSHEIIEFACIRRSPAGLEVDRRSFKVMPEHLETASERALEVNGFSEEAWKKENALSQSEAAKVIISGIAGSFLVGQNVAFDLDFIKQTILRKLGREAWDDLGRVRFIDTVTLAHEQLAPCGLDWLSLTNVCDFLGLSNQGAHTALSDVYRCMEVYDKLSRAGWSKRLWWRFTGPGRQERRAT